MSEGVLGRRSADRGSAAVVVAGMCAAVLVLGIAALMVMSASSAAVRARTAADLSALAGATARLHELIGSAEVDPCSAAASVAIANGATLTSCAVDGGVNVAVRVSVPVPRVMTWTAGGTHAAASARAGPAPP